MYLSVAELSPEKKVKLAISMTDTCVSVCADAVRSQNPEISERELVEKVRERINFGKRKRCEV